MDPKLSDLHYKIGRYHESALQKRFNSTHVTKESAPSIQTAGQTVPKTSKQVAKKKAVAHVVGKAKKTEQVDYRSIASNFDRSMERLQSTHSFKSKLSQLERMSQIQHRGEQPAKKREFFEANRQSAG